MEEAKSPVFNPRFLKLFPERASAHTTRTFLLLLLSPRLGGNWRQTKDGCGINNFNAIILAMIEIIHEYVQGGLCMVEKASLHGSPNSSLPAPSDSRAVCRGTDDGRITIAGLPVPSPWSRRSARVAYAALYTRDVCRVRGS